MRLHAHFGMLPTGAFERHGNRHIKLHGGGGIPIVSDVVDVVGDVVEGVGDLGQDVIDVVDDAGHFVDDAVNDVVPGGWATVAAVTAIAMGMPADPSMFASEAYTTAEAAALAEGATAAEAAAAGEAAYAAEAASAATATEGGLTAAETIAAENAAAETVAAETAAATTESALNTDAIINNAIKGAGKGAVTGGLTSAVSGGDPIEGALRGAVTGGVGGAAGSAATQYTGSNIAGGVAGGVAGGGTSALLGGRDPLTGALIGGLTGGTTSGINELTGSSLGSYLSPVTGQLISGLVNGDSGSSLTNTLLGSGGSGTTGTTGILGTTGASTLNPFDVGQGSIQNLTPGLTKADQNYELSGLPHMAAGSSTNSYNISDLGNKDSSYNPFAVDKFSYVKPGLTQANVRYDLSGLPGYLLGKKEGGSIPGHNPEFFSEGGLQHRYVKGQGDGTSDSVPAMLASGEFVIPADVVSGLGNGDNDSGAKVLDEFLRTIRQHKRRADVKKLPPDSKGPLGYLLEAKRKVRK